MVSNRDTIWLIMNMSTFLSLSLFRHHMNVDACSCDQGGDCECLCTALAAYAYECTAKGVNIRWRTPDLCRKTYILVITNS